LKGGCGFFVVVVIVLKAHLPQMHFFPHIYPPFVKREFIILRRTLLSISARTKISSLTDDSKSSFLTA